MTKDALPVVLKRILVLQVLNAIIGRSTRDQKEDTMVRRQKSARLLHHTLRRGFIGRSTENSIQCTLTNNQVEGMVRQGKSFRYVGTQIGHALWILLLNGLQLLVERVTVLGFHLVNHDTGEVHYCDKG